MTEAAADLGSRAPQREQSNLVKAFRLVRDWWPLALIAIWLTAVAAPGLIANQDPIALNLYDALSPPSAQHLLGTDEAGRDLWARCIWGIRYSLGVSILIVLGAAAIGTIIGGFAGLMRGWIDWRRDDSTGNSDHREFELAGMRGVKLGVLEEPVRHTAGDTPDRLQRRAFARVQRVLEAVLARG